MPPVIPLAHASLLIICCNAMWQHGLMLAHWSRSTKLLYAGPG